MDPVILFEDNHLLVCVKPAGVLSQADASGGEDMLTTLKEHLRTTYHKPGNVYLGLVHRLDRNVGGVMVFARTSKAAARLSAAIRAHDFGKRYAAVVEGVLVVGSTGTLTDHVVKDEEARVARVDAAGREAVLEYRVLANATIHAHPYTLLDVAIRTGRFHQIRAQLAHAGHPIAGDVKYGARPLPAGFGLYAVEIAFDHPVTGAPLRFTAVPPGTPFDAFPEFHP